MSSRTHTLYAQYNEASRDTGKGKGKDNQGLFRANVCICKSKTSVNCLTLLTPGSFPEENTCVIQNTSINVISITFFIVWVIL